MLFKKCAKTILFGLLAFSSVIVHADPNYEDAKLFREHLRKAEHGDPKAQFNVGNGYFLGVGVEKNLDQALAWHRKSAEQGNDWSQAILGAAYYGGEGMPKEVG